MKGNFIHTNKKNIILRRNDDEGVYEFIKNIIDMTPDIKKQAEENDREEVMKEIEEEYDLERRLYENVNDDDDYDCLPFI